MSRIDTALAGIGLAALLAAVPLAGPSLAQQMTADSSGTQTAPAATAPTASDDRAGPGGSLEKSNGLWRGGKIIGARVYNQNGDTVGSVEDLLMRDDGKVTAAVVSVGGFLGIGAKLVSVPFDQLRFEPSRQDRTTTTGAATTDTSGTATPGTTPAGTATPGAIAEAMHHDYFSLVLPDATKQSLSSAAGFSYGNP